MAEWLYEAGIGEARAALVEGGRIVEAAIEPEGVGPRLGTVSVSRLSDRLPDGRSQVVLEDGTVALLDRTPPGLSQGRRLAVRITREPIPEPGRPKRAHATPADDTPAGPGPDLLARIEASGITVRRLRPHEPDDLEAAGWSEVLEEAASGEITFAMGALRLSPTPAMVLFDVDGGGPAELLAVGAAAAVGAAIRRHGIGGSIGIDFPTLGSKAARSAVGAALDAALPPPFERTAVNGFGFLQIVRPRHRASLPELIRSDPAARLRAALRRLEREPSGTPLHIERSIADALRARPNWVDELVRRTGRHPIWPR